MRKTLLLAAVAAGALLARRRSYRWDGRVALVVGGSRGLGLLVARRIGRRGAKVVLAARSEPELEEARRRLEEEGIDVEVVAADVSQKSEAFDLVQGVAERCGRLDVLVNMASIIQVAPLQALALDDLRAAMDVNFWGTVFTTCAALPHLRRRPGARIVNVSSISGEIATPHLLPYTAAKYAVTGFSEGLQMEVDRQGVRVVTVIPWLMRTGSAPHALVKGRKEAEGAIFQTLASLPLLTVSAKRAADRIVKGIERGERHVTIGVGAKVTRVIHALMPGTSGFVLGLVDRLLPRAPKVRIGGAEAEATEARRHPSAWTRSPLTLLGRRAAERYNEL